MSDIEIKDRCLECGGTLKPNPRTGVLECIYCHREYRNIGGGYDEELQEIVNQRQLREFIKAEELCEKLLIEQPESSEAHWQMLLAKLGVVYVQEGGEMKPTFFSCSYEDRESILNDPSYKSAVSYARGEEEKGFYEVKARELDSLLKEFFNLVKKEKFYDIFISFKQTVEARVGNDVKIIESDDCRKAREIYEHFKDKYNVFFSPVSIGQDTGIEGEKYEPRILKALQSSQAMILVGFSEQNVRSQWVENEWRRYKYYIDKGKKAKNSLIYVYEKRQYWPSALKDIQLPNIDAFEGNYLEQLEKKLEFVQTKKGLKSRVVTKKLNTDFETEAADFGYSKTTRTVISNKGNKASIKVDATEERDLETAMSLLNHDRFSDAEKQFKIIIKRNKASYKAYWGMFMAKIKAKNEQAVASKLENLNASDLHYLDDAVVHSPDEAFSWSIIDTLIDGFDREISWKKLKPVYEFITKYLDFPRIEKMHGIIGDLCCKYVSDGDVRLSENIFDSAKEIFVEEVKESTIDLLNKYGLCLLENSKYSLAAKRFGQLASIHSSSEVYLNLLAARLMTNDVTQVKINLKSQTGESTGTKKPAELDVNEIIERIVICNVRERKEHSMDSYGIRLSPYFVKAGESTNSNEVINAIQNAKNITFAEAKRFAKVNHITDLHTSWGSAKKVDNILKDMGINSRIVEVKPSKNSTATPITINQLIELIMAEKNCDYEAARKYISENNLYAKSYTNMDDAKAVVEKLGGIGIANVSVFEVAAVGGNDDKSYEKIRSMILFQVENNAKNVHPFMETVVSCYRQMEEKDYLTDIMYRIADKFVETGDFKQANVWYNEILIDDPNDSQAHWGTLKCRLKAANDEAVSKHYKVLMGMQEFNNARNCADDVQYKHYMDVYYRGADKKAQKERRAARKGMIKQGFKHAVAEFFRGIYLLVCLFSGLLMMYEPSIYFRYVHFGWIIAAACFVYGIPLSKAKKNCKQIKGMVDTNTYVQTRKYRYAACRLIIIRLAIITMILGLFMSCSRTYYINDERDYNISDNMPNSSNATFIRNVETGYVTEDGSESGVTYVDMEVA